MNPVARLSIQLLPLFFSVILHEIAHGWVAERRGDPTARLSGRITLNPLPHVDPVGTLLIPIFLGVLGMPIIGWARPVPVNFLNLRNPRRDSMLVAVAGPGTNLLLALFGALLLRIALFFYFSGAALPSARTSFFLFPLVLMLRFMVEINLLLMVFNMVPIPPLDGSRVLAGVLSPGPARVLAQIEPFGMVIIFALLAYGVLGRMIGPMIAVLERIIFGISFSGIAS